MKISNSLRVHFIKKVYFFRIVLFLASIYYAFGFDPLTTARMSNSQKIFSLWITQGLFARYKTKVELLEEDNET